MENYENVNVEETEMIEATMGERSGMSTGVAMAVGAGLAAAVYGAVKLGKKLFTAFKDKQEQNQERDYIDEE